MAAVTFHHETPVEYFKARVDEALSHQKASARDLTAFYLVNLLTGFVHLDRAAADGRALDDEPLALKLGRAYSEAGARQRAALREVGDLSLFVAGFFGDSLRRSLVDVDYYVALGGAAYGSLSRRERIEGMAEVFAELAERFDSFVDVLAEVSERTALTSSADLLRTYERWLRTGSPRDGQRLVACGIVPNASIATRFIQ